MGEQYYIPPILQLTDDTKFSISWVGDNYRIVDGCPDRTNVRSVDYIQLSGWGFTTDIGTTDITSTSRFVVGSGCDTNEYDISVASVSRSLFDTPNLTPYEPIYFLAFFAFSVWVFASAFKLIFGKGWK